MMGCRADYYTVKKHKIAKKYNDFFIMHIQLNDSNI